MAQSALNVLWGNFLKKAKAGAAKKPAAKAPATAKLKQGATGSDIASQQAKAPATPAPAPKPTLTQQAQSNVNQARTGTLSQRNINLGVPETAKPGETLEETMKNLAKSPTMGEEIGPMVQNRDRQATGEAILTQQREQEQSDRAEGQINDIEVQQTKMGKAFDTQGSNLQAGMADFEKEADQMEARAAAAGGEVKMATTGAIKDTQAQVNRAQGIIDTKEQAALAGAARGEAAAAQSAVQGMQQQTRVAVAQINADPNLTDAQKRSMVRQTQMQGAAAVIPAVGANIATFTKIRTDTAVAFGNMTTQIQTAGISGVAGIAQAGMQAFANTKVAAAQVGANILATRASAADNYADNQAQITNMRTTLELGGESLKASLLPTTGTPVAHIADVMTQSIADMAGIKKLDMGNLVGMAGIQSVEAQNKISEQMSWLDIALKGGQMLFGAFG